MSNNSSVSDIWPIGVFTSIDEGFGVHMKVAQELGVPTVHLHAPSEAQQTKESAQEFSDLLAGLGLRVTVVFAGFEGESYADIPTVIKTIGLAPEATRAVRVERLKRIIEFTNYLKVDATGLHIGFVPHNSQSKDFAEIVAVTQQICDFAKEHGVNIHLETGQEPVDVLILFIKEVDRPNLFVNFDPANMIIYGCGEPIPALKELAPYIRSVHCKDGKWSAQPGVTWGEETPLGEGEVDMQKYLSTLKQIGYQGPLTIEREISSEPERQKTEIGGAITLLERLKQEILA